MSVWDDANKAAGGQPINTAVPSAGQTGGWAAANAAASRSTAPAAIPTVKTQTQKPQSILLRTPTAAPASPFLANTSISALAPVEGLSLEGVTINRPTSLYGTENGRAIVDVGDNPRLVTGEKSSFLDRMVAGAGNVAIGAITGVSKAFGEIFDIGIATPSDEREKKAYEEQIAKGNITNPVIRERVDAGKPAFPTTAEKVGAGLDIVTAGANVAFTGVAAELEAAKEIPFIGKPIFGTVSKGFELLDHASRFVGGKIVDVLPVDDATKAVLRRPIEDLAGIVGTLAGVKAVHGVSKTGGGRIVDALPVSDLAKSRIKTNVATAAAFSMQPFSFAYRGIVGSIKNKVEARQAAGQEVTPDIAKVVVSQAVKETPTPDIAAVMDVPTPSGKVQVHTNQKLVLQNLIQGREDLTYRVVDDLGASKQTGEPIKSRFEWNYKTQQGTVYVTNKTTAVDLAHELGHYVDRQLGAALGKRLSDVIPDYRENSVEVNQMLADYALNRLGGDATHAEISAETLKIAENISAEMAANASFEARQTPGRRFAAAFGDVLNNPTIRKNAPELAQLADFSLGDVTRKGGKPDIVGEPGSREEASSVLAGLEGAKRDAIRAKKESTDFQEKRMAADMERAAVEEAGKAASSNFAWRDVVSALRASKEFRKEGTVTDNTINGVLMEKGGKTVIVAFSDVKRMQGEGWKSRFTMDEMAHANGFERAEDYVLYVMELDTKMRAIGRSSEQRAAHESLIKDDPNYARLSEQIEVLREQLASEEATVFAEKQGSARDARQVPATEQQKANVDISEKPIHSQEAVVDVEAKPITSGEPSYQGTGSGSVRRPVDSDTKLNNLSEEIIQSSLKKEGTFSEEVADIVRSVKDNPDAEITVYRGSEGEINPGDWVALTRAGAEKYTKTKLGSEIPGTKVHELTVKASDIVPQIGAGKGNVFDFAYFPKEAAKPRTERAASSGDAPRGTSGVGKSIARKTIEQGLEDSFGATAGYDKITIADQARRMEDLINNDMPRVRRILTGEEALPDGLRGGAVIKAVEEYALKTGDPDLAFELANSPLTSETSVHAQEMRLLAERTPDSATARLQAVKKARLEAVTARLNAGKTVDGMLKDAVSEIKDAVKKSRPTKETWSSFVDSIKC